MGALEQITQLRNQGLSDENIMQNLQSGGFSSNEINDAFSQAQIKQAVADDAPGPNSGEGNNQQNIIPGQQPTPQQNEMYQQQEPQAQEEMYYPQPQDNLQGVYQDQGDYYSPGSVDTSTVIEIAEQVFLEKIQNLQKQVDDSTEFRTLATSKIENLSERLKKIEKIIDDLQISILQKVSSYGGNLESVKKEMSMMQDSFRKMVNPIVKYNERKIIPKKEIKKNLKQFQMPILKKPIKIAPIQTLKKIIKTTQIKKPKVKKQFKTKSKTIIKKK